MNDYKIPALEIFYLSVIPINCIIVSFLLASSIIIFSKTRFNNKIIYKYIIVYVIIQLSLVFTILAYVPQQCSSMFKLTNEYKKYFDFLHGYLFQAIGLLSILVNLSISYIRFATISRPQNFNKCRFFSILLVFLLLSIILSLIFSYSPSKFKASINTIKAGVFLFPIISVMVLNCMIIITTYLKTKRSQNDWALNYSSVNLNRIQVKILQIKLTKMIIFQSAIQLLSLVLVITYFLNKSHFNKFTDEKLMNTAVHLVFLACCYISMLIFYKFNKFFAFHFVRNLRIIFTNSCSKVMQRSRGNSRIFYDANNPIQETQL